MHATNSTTQLKTQNRKQKSDEEKLKRIFIHSDMLSLALSVSLSCLFMISRADAARPHDDLLCSRARKIGR